MLTIKLIKHTVTALLATISNTTYIHLYKMCQKISANSTATSLVNYKIVWFNISLTNHSCLSLQATKY